MEALRQVVAADALDGAPLDRAVHSFFKLLHRHGRLTRSGCPPHRAAGDLVAALLNWRGWVGPWWGLRRRRASREWTGRVWLVGLGEQARSRRLWEPMAEALGGGAGLLLAAGPSQLRHLPETPPAVSLMDYPAGWWRTRGWLAGRLGRWLHELGRVCSEFDFASAARWRLAAHLVQQADRISALLRLERRLRPRAAVVDWDRAPLGAAVCAALGARGVPTFTLVHGAFGAQSRAGFVPLGARFVLTWGEVQSALLREVGVPAERIIPVGVFEPRPLPPSLEPAARAQRLTALQARADRPVVVLGLTCLNAEGRALWARVLRELAGRLADRVVLARLHPSNTRASFAGLLEESPTLRLVDDRMLSAAETLELADAVVVDSSSFGFDALQRGLPVVTLEPPDGSRYFSLQWEAIQAGASLYARNAEHLASQLARLRDDAGFRAALLARARAFEARYVCAYGQEALARARAAIEEGIEKSGVRSGN